MIKTKLHHSDGKLIVERVQDIQPILEANKRQFDVDDKRYKNEVFNHVARIPLVVLEKWANEKGIKYREIMNDPKILRRFLNDPENKYFRTKPGKL